MTKAAFNGGCNPNRKQPVPRACNNCKASHLACNLFRPCKRCVSSGKTDSCRDVKHRKRGRPKLHGERSASHGYRWESRNPQDTVGRTVRVLRIDAIRGFISENERASHYGEPKKKYEEHIESQRSEALPDPEPPPRIQCSVVTLYLSMDLCCTRVSDEAILLWGYHPQELVHKSIYTFIATNDRQRIQRLHERLLKEIWTKSSTSTYEDLRHLFSSELVVSSLISQADPAALAVFAKEAGKFTDTVDISKRLGDKERFQVSLYLGGGLGGDLRLKATLSKLYIVANFTRMKATTTEKEDWGSDPDIRADVGRENDKETIAANKEFEAHSVQQRGISILNNLEELPVRPGMLPGHFSRNSQLNTISFSDPKLRSPRIHVAVKHDVSHQQHFRLSVPTRTTLLPIPGSNPTSTQAYRHAPSTLSRSGTPNTFVSRATTSTNPTAQYFLQTSSSSLNAAASAIQGKQPSETETDVTSGVGLAGNSSNKLLGKKDSAQQHAPRMSIRSLLS